MLLDVFQWGEGWVQSCESEGKWEAIGDADWYWLITSYLLLIMAYRLIVVDVRRLRGYSGIQVSSLARDQKNHGILISCRFVGPEHVEVVPRTEWERFVRTNIKFQWYIPKICWWTVRQRQLICVFCMFARGTWVWPWTTNCWAKLRMLLLFVVAAYVG